jgi:pyruvate dehydrogenase E2 component (dihydrolipoamide acetyltransferase)
MPIDILVPPLSQTMDTLVLVEWVKKVGDPVTKGETLFTVETDKAILEVEAPVTGVLRTILAKPGDEIKVKSVIGSIAEPGEVLQGTAAAVSLSPTEKSQPLGIAVSSSQPVITTIVSGGRSLPVERSGRIFASPRARRLAGQQGISLTELQGSGTGPQRAIIERDVKAYLEQQSASPRVTPVARRMAEMAGVDLRTVVPARAGTITKADVQASLQQPGPSVSVPASEVAQGTKWEVKLTPTRKTIARRMLESHRTVAPVTYMSEVDATRLTRMRKRILRELREGADRPTITDFLVRITCLVLAQHPELNATFDGETLELHESVHMALAVDTPRGLLAPVIRNAERKGLTELAHLRNDLVDRAVKGTITPLELSDGTFTITNLGTLGIDHFTPIINTPQVAILGVGRIREVPAVKKGKIRIRQVMGLAITCDHRIIDGAPAARFLKDICTLVERPDVIWL